MNTDLYAILGVKKDATPEEIKAAYLKLSKALHPDVNPHGATLMQGVNEAHEVLSDPAKRRAYDRGEKVRAFRPSPAANVTPGTIDLTKLAQAFIPPNVYAAAGPSLERALQDRGISPQAASVESILESFGVLKKKRGRKSA